jgi:uncharacterized C2H2 Zn-finger protein
MASTEYRQHSLPKLSTPKDLARRDSLSSSRTRDSGYNSDLDVACSPLDYIDTDQRMLLCVWRKEEADTSLDIFLAPLPSLVTPFVRGSTVSTKLCGDFQTPKRLRRANITSHPLVTGTTSGINQYFGTSAEASKSDADYNPHSHSQTQSNLAAQDEEIEKWIKDNLPSHNRPKERVLSITSISSASSCDMYTATDPSEDEHEVHDHGARLRLTRSAIKTIEVIVKKVEVNLRYSAFLQCNGGNSCTTARSRTSFSHQSDRKASQSAGKRKSRSDDHPPPNEDEDEGPNKRRRGSLATISNSDTWSRFACPFFKHEPNRYRNRRTCPGPGWPTVHRMKEHLYRAHAQSIYCPRCYTMFDTDTDLSNHLRSAHCHVSAPQPIEGIDRETLKALRKRSPALRLEEDKWRDVYHLLFPHVAVGDTPSPCKLTHSVIYIALRLTYSA